MPRGAIHTVEDVLQQALVLAGIDGKICPFYFVKWAGYPLARATWEPRESFSAGNPVMAANILPLEAQLERYGKKELAAHHRQTLKLAQHELRRVIQRWEQARGDFLISCLLRVELLTAYRLWFQRLSRLAPGMRKAGDGELWTGCTSGNVLHNKCVPQVVMALPQLQLLRRHQTLYALVYVPASLMCCLHTPAAGASS